MTVQPAAAVQPYELTLSEAAGAIAARSLSPVELVVPCWPGSRPSSRG